MRQLLAVLLVDVERGEVRIAGFFFVFERSGQREKLVTIATLLQNQIVDVVQKRVLKSNVVFAALFSFFAVIAILFRLFLFTVI